MIIIPVEKRLKWSRAPYVLFGLVLLNIAIFFFYQINDVDKIGGALEAYQKQKLHEVEVPLYLDYVRLPDNIEQRQALDEMYLMQFGDDELDDQLDEMDDMFGEGYMSEYMQAYGEDFERQMREQRYQQVAVPLILQDSKFYDYLVANPKLFESKEVFADWRKKREPVNTKMQASSGVNYGLIPAEKNWFSFISHQFMHGDIMHLAGNMFFLIMCGFAVEAAIGHLRFLLFYLIGGVAGGFAHAFAEPTSTLPLVGASGAISGVMAMYLGVFRLKKIEFFYWFYVLVGYFKAPALVILLLYIGKEVFMYVTGAEGGVAYMAHAGGFVAGFVLIAGVLLFKRDLLDDDYIEQDDSIDPAQAKQAQIMDALEQLRFKQALQLLDDGGLDDKQSKYHADNLMLKAKLLFMLKDSRADAFATDMLGSQPIAQDRLSEHVSLWRQVKKKDALTPDARLKVALKFCDLNDISLAEGIFKSLVAENYQDSRMSVLAGRIAHFYEQQRQSKKADQYLQLANGYR